MAEESRLPSDDVPPPTEVVHLPRPSYLPVTLAFGLTLGVVGVVITWVLSAIGVIISLVAIVRWIRETREDIEELPLEQ
jgi:hypothetical protein